MCICRERRAGFRCVSTRAVSTINISNFNQLAEIELRGNGGCGGNGSRVSRAAGGTTQTAARGGDGGNGGGGLYIAASAFNVGNLTIDTSGLDGEVGEVITGTGSRGTGTVAGGSGAGGNAGRVILIEDGSPSSIPDTRTFVTANRGRVPFRSTPCTGLTGDTNVNRQELAVAVSTLNCVPQLEPGT